MSRNKQQHFVPKNAAQADVMAGWLKDSHARALTFYFKPGSDVALEFAQSETIRRATVVGRKLEGLGHGTMFDVHEPATRIFVYDKDIEIIGPDLMAVLSPHKGM